MHVWTRQPKQAISQTVREFGVRPSACLDKISLYYDIVDNNHHQPCYNILSLFQLLFVFCLLAGTNCMQKEYLHTDLHT